MPNQITGGDLMAILESAPQLMMLTVIGACLDEPAAEAVAFVCQWSLPHLFPQLQELTLQYCRMSDSLAVELATALRGMDQLVSLHLSSNPIMTPEGASYGAVALARSLPHWPRLRYINVDTGIDMGGVTVATANLVLGVLRSVSASARGDIGGTVAAAHRRILDVSWAPCPDAAGHDLYVEVASLGLDTKGLAVWVEEVAWLRRAPLLAAWEAVRGALPAANAVTESDSLAEYCL
jgi:hypothetical protein